MNRLRFDGAPGPKGPRFIEAEDGQGRGICIGKWQPDTESPDWFLVLEDAQEPLVYMLEAIRVQILALTLAVMKDNERVFHEVKGAEEWAQKALGVFGD